MYINLYVYLCFNVPIVARIIESLGRFTVALALNATCLVFVALHTLKIYKYLFYVYIYIHYDLIIF